MIPVYLQDLYLDELFEDVSSYLIESCEISEHIVDCQIERICNFVKSGIGAKEENEKKFFEVNNPDGKLFCLLQIDNGVIKNNDTKKCDCAVLSKDNIAFIEFKANMLTEISYMKKYQYKKAQEQLKTTINHFKNGISKKGQNLLNIRKCSAHICFRKGYPRLTAQEINFRVKFADQTGIALFFDGKMTL